MKYGLVLAGGGVRGAYQIGVWKALKELKIKISAVSGVSIGAVNGALFVQGSKLKAERLWNKIAIDDIISLPKKLEDDENLFKAKNLVKIAKEIYNHSGLDMSPFENLLNEIIDEDKIRESDIDFGIATFSISDKSENYYFIKDLPYGKLTEYLMASACFPGFKARTIDEKKFIDGGVSNNMPINMLLEKEIDNIIAIDVKGVGFYRTFNLAGKNVINIKCSRPQTGTFDFDRDGIRKSIQDGYYDCMKTFGKFSGGLYNFRTRDYTNARSIYSKELIEGIENAANIFGVNPYKLYTINELVSAVMNEYYDYVRQHNGEISGGVFEKIKSADERLFLTWIVDVLEKGKSDFVKEKLSILGEKYDAASAILYFKLQK